MEDQHSSQPEDSSQPQIPTNSSPSISQPQPEALTPPPPPIPPEPEDPIQPETSSGQSQESSLSQSDAPITSSQSSKPAIKAKAPAFAVVIAVLMLLGGIGSLMITLPLLLAGGTGGNGVLLGLGGLNLIEGIALVVVAFGILKMRRWAFYAFIAVTILGIILEAHTAIKIPYQRITAFAGIGIELVVLLYFWSISKKFN